MVRIRSSLCMDACCEIFGFSQSLYDNRASESVCAQEGVEMCVRLWKSCLCIFVHVCVQLLLNP